MLQHYNFTEDSYRMYLIQYLRKHKTKSEKDFLIEVIEFYKKEIETILCFMNLIMGINFTSKYYIERDPTMIDKFDFILIIQKHWNI